MIRNTRMRRKFSIALVPFVILSLMGGYLVFQEPEQAEAVWMDENWVYRRPLTVSNSGSEVTNQFVRFSVDTATLEPAKLQTDCDDARFTDINGDLLRYFLGAVNACNLSNTTFDVLIPTIFAGATSTVIYFYYGNPSAGAGTQAAAFTETQFSPSGTTYGTEEAGPGPVGYWKFDEGFGQTVNDSTSANNDGTIPSSAEMATSTSGSSGWKTEDLCITGKCLALDGTNDYISLASSPLSGTIYSVSAWFKTNSASTAQSIFAQRSSSDGDSIMGQLYLTTSNIAFITRNDVGGNSALAQGTTILQSNAWYYAVGVRDGTNVYVYLNGIQEGSDNDAGGTITTNVQDIGRYNIGGSPAGYFDGNFDEVKIYPYARSLAQIQADFLAKGVKQGSSAAIGVATTNSGAVQSTLSDGLVGYWRMDESAANSCSGGVNDSCDSSGNGYNLAWKNDATATTTASFGRALTFDGTGDQATTSAFTTLNSSFSWGFWLNADSLSGDRVYLESEDVSAPGIDTTGSTLRFQMNNSNIITNTISASTWYHVFGIYDELSQTQRFYVDGALIGTNTSVASDTIGPNVYLGARGTGQTLGADARMDEVRIYNRVLSSKEVRDLYYWAPGPVGYWNFDEGTGTTANDRSTNANTGTLNNMSRSINGGWTQGRFGKGLDFDGTDDYVSTADQNYFSPSVNDITVSAWANIPVSASASGNGVCGSTGRYFVAKGVSSNWEWAFENDNNNLLCLTVWELSGDNSTSLEVTRSINDGNWHHYAATIDYPNMVILYIDGIEMARNSTSTFTIGNGTQPVEIGRRGDGNYFDGQIDDVRIYNYARTQKQIVEDMNAGHPAVGSPVGTAVGHWAFDEVQGQTLNNKITQSTTTLNFTRATSTDASASDPTWKTSSECRVNGCLDFDGVNDFAEVYDSSALDFGDTADFTLTGWFWRDTATTDDVILAKRNSLTANTDAGYILYIDATGDQLIFEVSDGTDEFSATSTSAFTSTGWNHFAAVWDQDATSTTEIYLNGQDNNATKSGTIELIGSLANAVTSRVGSESDGASYFDGKIDEIKIYNFVLTADEIKLEYNMASAVNFGTGRLENTSDDARFYWKLDEGAGSTANNSGNATNTSNGTVTGATWREGNYCKINACLDFDGTDDYAEVSDNDSLDFFNDADDFTISGWFWRDTATTDDVILAKRNSLTVNTDVGYILYIDATGDQLIFEVSDGTDEFSATSTTAFTSTGWNHFAAVWDDASAANTEIFVNGVDDNATDAGTIGNVGALSNAVALRIGSESDGASFFDGFLDEIKIHPYARSSAQIAADAATGPENPARPGVPVGEWLFDEGRDDQCAGGTNDACDTSGNGNNGAKTFMATSTNAGWLPSGDCYGGKCLDFDGTDDYVDLGNGSSLNIANSFLSISAWINKRNNNQSNYIVAKTNSGGYALESNTSGNLNFVTPGSTNHTGSTAVSSNAWNHAAVTVDGVNVRLYVNGVLDSTIVLGGSISGNSSNVRIGNRESVAGIFDGRIDQVRIYDYALTPAQIAYEYNRGKPIGHWKFDECQGGTAYDSSGDYSRGAGGRNNGTITIGATGTNAVLGTCTNASTTASWWNASSTKMNSGLSFDGTDDEVSLGDVLDMGSSDFTLSAWVNTDVLNSAYHCIITKNASAFPNYQLCIDSLNRFQGGYEVSAGNTSIINSGLFGISTDTWYHVAVAASRANNTILYVNGIEVRRGAAVSGSLNNTQTLYIGMHASSFRWDGEIDDVRIYSYALDVEQIRKVFNDGAGVRFGPDIGQP